MTRISLPLLGPPPDEPYVALSRRFFTGRAFLRVLRPRPRELRGRLLVQLPVGFGKSHWIARAARAARTADPDALVLVLAPRLDILAETRDRLTDLDPVTLRGRPRGKCGSLDAEWRGFEEAGCAALARQTVCGRCPRAGGCEWRRQFRQLAGARVVLATHQRVASNPGFVQFLRDRTGAPRVLTLVDEIDLVLQPFTRVVPREAVEQLGQVIDGKAAALVAGTGFAGTHQWRHRVTALLAATPADLRDRDWALPVPSRDWLRSVQQGGRDAFGEKFRYAGHDLQALARSLHGSRGLTATGGVSFAAVPDLGDEYAVFGAFAPPRLVEHRMGGGDPEYQVYTPTHGLDYVHPGTRFININTRLATRGHFWRNAPQILDLVAQLVARNVRAGRRTLLVSRKVSVKLCRRILLERLASLGLGDVRIVTGGWAGHNLGDPRTVPLITYGVRGVNLFQDFDAAYCLNSYLVPPAAVEELVNDLRPPGERIKVSLSFTGDPPRRTATLVDVVDSDLEALANEALAVREADVVVQAVGRVRPFTRPREVVTLHPGELPGVEYDHEFQSLAEARNHFELGTARQRNLDAKVARAHQLRREGLSRKQIVAATGWSLARVKDYLKSYPRPSS